MLDASYRILDGCHNCAHAFHKLEYECAVEYFCTNFAPPRPKCGSVLMHEHPERYGDEGDELDEAWDAWAENRQVQAFGLCDDWEPIVV